ncbi:MAG: GerMN domain-containing protein [Desulfuromonadales bacterium]
MSAPRKRVSMNLLIPFLIIVLVFSALIWRKYQTSRAVPPPKNLQPAVSGTRTVSLFFVNDAGRLVREVRELDPCENADSCLRDLVDELLNGPLGDLEQPLPDGTIINSVSVQGNRAVVDLGGIFIENMPAGSSAEMIAVYSLVDTITTNMPQVNVVKLTVEGNEKILLRHLDLSEPLAADYSLEQLSPDAGGAAPPVKKGTP